MSAGVFSVTLLTLFLIGGAAFLFSRARRTARGELDATAPREETHRYLAENWSMVEQTARASGMTEEEIARVRANVLDTSK